MTQAAEEHTVDMRECAGIQKEISRRISAFALRTTDGQEFIIPHAEFLLIGDYSIALLDKQGYINTLDPLHIVSTRELSRRNGGGR